MKKQELNLMEIYVYANQIRGLSECVLTQNKSENEYLYSFGKFAENLSSNLLKNCEKKIKKQNLNSFSFLVLKTEISSFKFYTSREKNLRSLCDLLQKYSFYDNLLTGC